MSRSSARAAESSGRQRKMGRVAGHIVAYALVVLVVVNLLGTF